MVQEFTLDIGTEASGPGTGPIDEIWVAYEENASYEEDGSISKAKKFITACRKLLNPSRSPMIAEHGGELIRLNLELVRKELEDAQEFVANGGERTTPDRAVYYSLEHSRD